MARFSYPGFEGWQLESVHQHPRPARLRLHYLLTQMLEGLAEKNLSSRCRYKLVHRGGCHWILQRLVENKSYRSDKPANWSRAAESHERGAQIRVALVRGATNANRDEQCPYAAPYLARAWQHAREYHRTKD